MQSARKMSGFEWANANADRRMNTTQKTQANHAQKSAGLCTKPSNLTSQQFYTGLLMYGGPRSRNFPTTDLGRSAAREWLIPADASKRLEKAAGGLSAARSRWCECDRTYCSSTKSARDSASSASSSVSA